MERTCGSCTACCRVYPIPALNKPTGKWCQHCDVGKGCKIYEQRPKMCADYECSWLVTQHNPEDQRMPPEMRPDRCKVVFNQCGEKVFAALVLPGHFDAWRKGAAREAVDTLVEMGNSVVAGFAGTERRTLISRYGEREVRMGPPDANGGQDVIGLVEGD